MMSSNVELLNNTIVTNNVLKWKYENKERGKYHIEINREIFSSSKSVFLKRIIYFFQNLLRHKINFKNSTSKEEVMSPKATNHRISG